MGFVPIPANEDTVFYAESVWNIGRVADFLESMTAAIYGLQPEMPTIKRQTQTIRLYVVYCRYWHHDDVSVNCMRQQFHVTIFDSICQFVSKSKAHCGH